MAMHSNSQQDVNRTIELPLLSSGRGSDHTRWPTDSTFNSKTSVSKLHSESASEDSIHPSASNRSGLAVSYGPTPSHHSLYSKGGSRKLSSQAFVSLLPLIGQCLLMTFTWGFWGYIIGRGHLVLPDSTASLIQRNAFIVTITTTLVATCLSLFSAFLFSTALKQALATHISRPISLIVFTVLIELSKGAFVFKPRHIKWTLSTLICTLALNTMTAGWTSLLQPYPILVSVGIHGDELNFTSPAFSDLLRRTPGFDFSSTNGFDTILGSAGATLSIVIDSSGIASARSLTSSPSTFINYNGASYNDSTGGILPTGPLQSAGLPNTRKLVNFTTFTTGSIPPRYVIEKNYPQPKGGFDTNITMTQQGFTARVTCRSADDGSRVQMNASTEMLSGSIGDPVSNTSWQLQKTNWTGVCPDGVRTNAQEVVTLAAGTQLGGQVAGLLCPRQNLDGKSDWSTHVLLIQGNGGSYSFIRRSMCAITPIVTTNFVSYSSSAVTLTGAINPIAASDEDSSILGSWVVQNIAQRFSSTQGLRRNSIGDALTSVRETLAESERDDRLNELMEEYLRGVVEFYGTFIRVAFSAEGSLPSSEIPVNMTSHPYGLLKASSWGWEKASAAKAIILMPMTFVALLTAFVTMMTYQLWDDDDICTAEEKDCKPELEKFDPTDSMHLILAASHGGIRDLTSGFEKDKVVDNETVEIHFGAVTPLKPGFVQDSR